MSQQRQVLKIVITGPVNAGKTTLIRHLSDTTMASTDVLATDGVAALKALTTVGLDFGILKVDETLEVHLFGTPGQERFNFMWNILGKGALGAVFLVDSADPDSLTVMKNMYGYFKQNMDLPVIVGATKQDLPDARDLEALSDFLELGPDAPILPCDARNREDTKSLVLTLLENILLSESAAASSQGEFDDLF